MQKVVNMATQTIISYARNKEDIILASFFQDVSHGFYVDVGAAHPDHLSATKFFYTKGWRGINIEPNERLGNLLSRVRPRDKTYSVAIADHAPRKEHFREYLDDRLSRIIPPDEKDEQSSGLSSRYYRDYTVLAERLSDVLADAQPKEIHFMKVSAATAVREVILSNDWDRFRPHVVCIAAGDQIDIPADMEKVNYQRIFHDGLNDYFADKKYYKKSLPEVDRSLIMSPRILGSLWAEKLEELQRELRERNDSVILMQEELGRRPASDGTGLRFRTLAKLIVKKTDAFITGKIAPARSVPSEISSTATNISYDRAVWDALSSDASPSVARDTLLRGYTLGKRTVKKAVKVIKGAKR